MARSIRAYRSWYPVTGANVSEGTPTHAHSTHPKAETRPVALTIAGFDPSSGAGITADLKTFAAHGVYGVVCITALTVQSTQGVRRVEPVSGLLIRETLACLCEDVPLAGVKLGMLATAEAVNEVARFLEGQPGLRPRVVLDPVIRSSSGTLLLDQAGLEAMRSRLLPQVGWITPNLPELALLTGLPISERDAIPEAARRLQAIAAAEGNPALQVVVTGGHLDRPDDFLLETAGADADEGGGAAVWLPGKHIETQATHGTGCAFSSALLSGLIAGYSALDAVTNAKAYVAVALRMAYPVGQGKGPIHHLFCMDAKNSSGC